MQRARRTPPIAMLVVASALGPLSLNIFLPSMPRLEQAFGTDYGTIQWTLSIYLIGMAVGQLIYGPLSDRFGRRPVLLAGLAVCVLSSFLCVLAPTIEVLIGGRLLQAIGATAGIVLGRAMVVDMFGRDRSAGIIGYMMMVMVVSPMIAPLLGGFLDEWFGWRASFAVVSGAAVLVLGFGIWLLHETNFQRQALPGLSGMMRSYASLLREPTFRAYTLQISLTSAGFFSFLGGAPYIVIEIMGRSPSEYGLYFVLGSFGYMTGNGLSGRLATRLGIDRMIGLGTITSFVGATAMLIMVFTGPLAPIALFGPMAIYAVGNGLTLPSGMAGAIGARPAIAGAASGLSGFLQVGVGALASVLVGHLVNGGDDALPMVAVIFATVALAAIAYVTMLARPRPGRAVQARRPAE